MKKGQIVAGLIWTVFITIVVLGYRYVYTPAQEEAVQAAEEKAKDDLVKTTSSESRFEINTRWAWDGFSGYSVIRSKEFAENLSAHRIGINGVDDGANYNERLKNLRDGKIDFAVFTVDALVKSSVNLGAVPGVIVMIIDESKGADAIVAYKSKWKNLDSLNTPETKFVIVPDSPSETLARIVMSNFNMDRLSNDPFIRVNSSEEVYKHYQQNHPDDPYVYVMWEPDVSKVLENENINVLMDSSKFSGFIVDVLIVSRDFLAKNRDQTQKVVESYFVSLYQLRNSMPKLVMEDAAKTGFPIEETRANILTNKILWRNTQENYVMFGLSTNKSLPHIGDVIENVTHVLMQTDGIPRDPTDGKPELLYYDQILKNMFTSNWHPGNESVRNDLKLSELSEREWKELKPVGTLKINDLEFRRGVATLSGSSMKTLTNLSQDLKKWPQYYLTLYGNASNVGDIEENKRLALSRANEAMQFLIDCGISKNRLRSETSDFSGSTVKFEFGEFSY